MRPAWQCLPDEPAHDAAAAALVILTHCSAARERFSAATERWPRLRVDEVALLTNPTALAREIAAARGVLIHLHNGNDHRDGVLRLAALLAARHVALAVVRDDDVADDVLDAISNLPPSTVRRLRALIGNNGVNAANATLTQFALAAGLSSFPSPLPTESRR
jgi:cobaltochelatase CobN